MTRVPGPPGFLRRAFAIAVLALAAGAVPAPRAGASEPPLSEPVQRLEGQPYVSGSALARLLQATRFWRADIRKMVLRSGNHRVVLTVDNPFVVVDDHTVRLPVPVRSLHGELQVPVALTDSLPRDSTLARLVLDPRGQRLVVVPPGGVVGSPRITSTEGITRVTFACEHSDQAKVVGRAHANFQVHLEGFFAGLLPDTIPGPSLVRKLRELPTASGSAFEMTVGPEAVGWRVVRDPDRVTFEFWRRPGTLLETFAPEGPPGPRALHVIVLDPGHGGEDAGVIVGEAIEKDLTLALARALKPELEKRLGARVVLTRDADVPLTADQRAEAANRSRADLVLSLHFDGLPGSRARGFTAYCPPATSGATAAAATGFPAPIEILPWRDVATRHAVRAREIAEAVMASIELRDEGPARLRETLAYPLLGVNAPGLLLECATLTSNEDLARLRSANGITDLATSIAEGVENWQRQR